MSDNRNDHIEDPLKYFWKLIRNSDKNEIRSNDNERKHSAPDGLYPGEFARKHYDTETVEDELAIQSSEDWLRYIDNPQLLTGLRSLRPDDLEFIFIFCTKGYTQRQMAEYLGVNQNAVHKRRKRILIKLRRFF